MVVAFPVSFCMLVCLQLIQNHAARIITRTKKFYHISGVLKNSTGYQSRRE